jgi:hypothetical protein
MLGLNLYSITLTNLKQKTLTIMNSITPLRLFLVLMFFTFGKQLSAQCLADFTVDPPNGSSAFTVQFTGQGSVPLADYKADSPVLPTGWSSTPFTIGSPCQNPDGSAPDNSDYLWVAERDLAGQRWIETGDMDLSAGGIISFDIRYGVTDISSDCRGPNSVNQGVELQYSTNGGADWTRITYYMPFSTDTLFTSWNSFLYNVPAAAQTSSTRLRWFQNSASNDLTDRWGLDNLYISAGEAVTSWEWDFGDMTTSDQQNPAHTFPGYGVFPVTLTITTAGGCTSHKTTDIYINSIPTIDNLIETDVLSKT